MKTTRNTNNNFNRFNIFNNDRFNSFNTFNSVFNFNIFNFNFNLNFNLKQKCIDCAKYTKYFYYFNKLLTILLVYKGYIYFYNRQSKKLNTVLYNSIQENGFIVIKMVQWLYTRIDLFIEIDEDNDKTTLNNVFSNIFENCCIHSLDYTKSIFNKDFSSSFDDIIEIDNTFTIKSASVAQVYRARLKNIGKTVALKVTHPELQYQIVFPKMYYDLYTSIVNTSSIFNNIKIPFNMDNFFSSILKQADMRNEYQNLKYFYKQHINNPCIIIPKPILCSKNILIMEYVEGKEFNKLECSEYVKYKIITLLNLFVKNSMFILDKHHGDLHNSNWKIYVPFKDDKDDYLNPKIVIYDFGFCINNNKDVAFILHRAVDTNNKQLFAEYLFTCIKKNPLNLSKEKFIDFMEKYIEKNNLSLYHNKSISRIFKYFVVNNYVFRGTIFEGLVTLLLIDKYLKKYIYVSKSSNIPDSKKIKIVKDSTEYYITTCKLNKIFYRLKYYLEDYLEYLNNNYPEERKNKQNTENKNIIQI